jgi:mRNA-degrading endonuclease toxin of MazEF toxin-antitoxin module
MARRSASGQRTPVADRGDIYLVSLDPTEGREQQGCRPVLVVSPGAFNRLTKVPIVLPITTGGNFTRVRGFTVSLTDAGTRTTGVVRCDQPRALDLGARGGRRLEAAPAAIVDEVLARLAPLFD